MEKKLWLSILFTFFWLPSYVLCQSNYDLQALDTNYTTKGLPPTAVLGGKATELDTLKQQIKLNRTTGDLNCASGFMHIKLSFDRPFYGLVYADFDRNSACYGTGSGDNTKVLEIPLRGCGTKEEPTRVFTNNVIVRFHPGLEMEGDEVITVVCRYPPPIVPPPPLALPVIAPPPPVLPQPIKEFEVLLIVCALLFLGITLLGLSCSYYCLKQRNIQFIHNVPLLPPEEESEKLSTIESYTHVKIPRIPPSSPSSSEAPLEETLASDYPSSIEEPQRPETASSEYSDTHHVIETEVVTAQVITKPPEFKVDLRVAEQPVQQMAYFETEGSISSIEEHVAQQIEIPELNPPVKRPAPPPPIFDKVKNIRIPKRHVQTTEMVDYLTIVDKEEVNTETKYEQPVQMRKPEITMQEVDDVILQTIVEKRLIEDEERKIREITQLYKQEQPNFEVQIVAHPRDDQDNWERGSTTTEVSSIGWSVVDEPPINPTFTGLSQDTYIRRQQVTQDATERTSVSRAIQKLEQDDTQIWNDKWRTLFRVLESPSPPRSLADQPAQPGPSTHHTEHHITTAYHNVNWDTETASILTEDDREKWRQIITTENTLRRLLTQATHKEDYERISRDSRFVKIFEPEKWDVIIRTISYPEEPLPPRDYDDTISEVSSSVVSSLPDDVVMPMPTTTTSGTGMMANRRSMQFMEVTTTSGGSPPGMPGGGMLEFRVPLIPQNQDMPPSGLGQVETTVQQQVVQQQTVTQSGTRVVTQQQTTQQQSKSSSDLYSSRSTRF